MPHHGCGECALCTTLIVSLLKNEKNRTLAKRALGRAEPYRTLTSELQDGEAYRTDKVLQDAALRLL